MSDSAPKNLGTLKLPIKNTSDQSQPMPIVFDLTEFHHLHKLVLSMA